MKNKTPTFGSQVSKGVFWKILTFGVGFIATIYFARVLGPQEYGIFSILIMLVNLLSNFLTGWASACKKRISEVDFPRDEAIGCGLIVGIVVAPLIAGLFVLVEQNTGAFGIQEYLIIFFILFVSISVFEVLNILLTGIPNFSNSMKIDAGRTTLKVLLQLLLVGIGLQVAGMVYGLILATTMAFPLMIKKLRTVPTIPSRESLCSVFQFARYSVPKYLVSGSYARLDIVLLGLLLTPSAVAQYQVVLKLMKPISIVATVSGAGLMGWVSRSHSQRVESEEHINRSLWFSSILAVPILFGTTALPNTLIEVLYGSAYQTPALVVIGIAAYKLLDTQTKQLESVIAGIDRPDINMKVLVMVLLIGGILGYGFVTAYGLVGMVLTLIVAETTRYAAMGYIVKRETSGVRLLSRPLAHQLVAASGMCALVRGFEMGVGVESITLLIAAVLAGAGTYFLLLYLLSQQHRGVVDSLVAKIAFRPHQ